MASEFTNEPDLSVVEVSRVLRSELPEGTDRARLQDLGLALIEDEPERLTAAILRAGSGTRSSLVVGLRSGVVLDQLRRAVPGGLSVGLRADDVVRAQRARDREQWTQDTFDRYDSHPVEEYAKHLATHADLIIRTDRVDQGSTVAVIAALLGQ